ncbi:MAG TPA: heme-binding domain-containing protein [Chitinophagaceae bacterium]|nr:heme-binding domain-containing protein [Chitinophagaceae bacterium]
MFKKIFVFLLIVLIIIQFIHPKRNRTKEPQPYAIANLYAPPENVKSILVKACMDCHSNNTRYPWYCNFQPFDWWIAKHIRHGKKGLNLDEYTNKSLRYQYHKLEEIIEQVKEGKMPLNSYLWIHKDAKLTSEEKSALIGWAEAGMDYMKGKYPPDSLIRKGGAPPQKPPSK